MVKIRTLAANKIMPPASIDDEGIKGVWDSYADRQCIIVLSQTLLTSLDQTPSDSYPVGAMSESECGFSLIPDNAWRRVRVAATCELGVGLWDEGGVADRLLLLLLLLLLLQMLARYCRVHSTASCCYGHSTMCRLRHHPQPPSATCEYNTSKYRCWTPVLALWMISTIGNVAGT